MGGGVIETAKSRVALLSDIPRRGDRRLREPHMRADRGVAGRLT